MAEAAGMIEAIHHVGMSVASLETALAFWEKFLGRPARWRTVLDRPYLGKHVGYPGIHIKAAFVDLPGGNTLELLDYQTDKQAQPDATANPAMCISASRSRMPTARGDTRWPAARGR